MGSGFKFEMSRNFERELDKVLHGTMNDIASDYQKMFDSLSRRYKGRPVSEVKPALRREWAQVGGSIADPELTDYATLISEGTRIEMKVE
jgi:hypothetical protein